MQPAFSPSLASVPASEKAPAPSKKVPDIPISPTNRSLVKKRGGEGGRSGTLPRPGSGSLGPAWPQLPAVPLGSSEPKWPFLEWPLGFWPDGLQG